MLPTLIASITVYCELLSSKNNWTPIPIINLKHIIGTQATEAHNFQFNDFMIYTEEVWLKLFLNLVDDWSNVINLSSTFTEPLDLHWMVQCRVATKIFEDALFKKFIMGREPVSINHYTRPGSSIKRPTPNWLATQCHVNWPKVATKSWIQYQRPSPKIFEESSLQLWSICLYPWIRYYTFSLAPN